jgi:hypothetical protein
MKYLLFALFFIASFQVQASKITEVKDLLSSTVLACPDRVWPGLNWENKTLKIVSPKNQTGLVILGSSESLSTGEDTQALRSLYSVSKDSISINIDKMASSQLAFEILVHEGFHAFNQSHLKHTKSQKQENHPLNYAPRLEREELALSLVDLISGKDSKEKASTWFYRHLSHGEDLSADLHEGSAEYVEAIAAAISKLGCAASEKDIIELALQKISDSGIAFDKSLEHYRIGGLSFLLARKLNLNLSLLLNEQTHPLLKILSRSDINENIISDSLLDHSADMMVSLTNRRNQEVIDKVENEKQLYFVPFTKIQGSFDHRGAFDFNGTSYYEEISIKSSRGIIEGNAKIGNACNANGFIISSDKPIENSGNIVFIKSKRIICL